MARIVAILLAALIFGALAETGSAASPPLSQVGRWVTDAHGRVVILHGVNMVYKRPPYHPEAGGFDAADARFLREAGLNTVRVGIIYKGVEPSPGKYDDAYLDRIAATVRALGREGIFAMLDFHQDLYNERFQGEGWPDWAVLDDGLPAEPKAGFPANYLVMPALNRAFDHFWANDPGPGGVGLQERYAAAWRHVAKRFRGNRWVMGYDLMNEPWPGSTWQQCANPEGCPVFDAIMAQFIKRTIAAIREVDRRSLIWYEPNVLFNDGADTKVGDTGDPRAGFSFHDYCLTQGGTQSDPLRNCDVFDDLVFQNAEDHVQDVGDTLLLTEFGATDDLDTMRQMVERADSFMVGWQHWHYCGCDDPTTSGPGDTQAIVIDPDEPPKGDNLKSEKLDVLSRPYPRRIAGTPRSFSFDSDAGVFELDYETRGPGGRRFGKNGVTKVFLPERQYPDGYAVEVEDARVLSEPGAEDLRLAPCHDRIRNIEVRVTRGKGPVTGPGCKQAPPKLISARGR